MDQQQWLMFVLQQAGQTAANLKGYYAQKQLADVLMGTPGQPAQLGPMGGGTTFAGSPELGGQANVGQPGTPGTPGLLPGVDPRLVQAMMLMPGGREQLLQAAMQRAMPEQITPYQQAQLELSERGIGLEERGLGMQERRLEQGERQFGEEMGLRRDQMATEDAYRRAQLILRDAEVGATGRPKLSDIAGFRKEYADASQDFVKMRDAYSKISAAGADVSPAGDLSLIFNFMRMLDPGSTVREGEFAQVAASGALGERFTGYGNMLLTGQRLTDAQRSDVLAQTANVMREQLGHQVRTEREFGELAERYGVPARDVVTDLLGDLRQGVPEVERVAPESPQSFIGRATDTVRDTARDFLGTPTEPQASEEGLTATNPATGERIIFRNGQWVPL